LAEAVNLNTNIATSLTVTMATVRSKGTPHTGLQSIVVMEETQDIQTANYTINYKVDDAVVKTVSSSSAVGAEIKADMAIDGEGDYTGNHYVIVADAVPSMTLVAGENVLDVPVRAPYAATLKVTTTVNGTASEETFELTETDAKDNSYSYAFSKYVKSGDVYYVCDADKFAFNGTFTDGEVIEKAVSYTNADENIVFFKEAESAAGKDENCSWGGGGHVGAQNARDRGVSVGTLPAGNYLFTVNILANNRRSVVLRQSTNDPMALVGTSNEDSSTGLKSAYFALDEETSGLLINGANVENSKTNQSEDYDYVVIRKIDEMVIVGDFAENGWNVNGIAMTQSTENEWTVVVENFEAEAKNYYYKALYHGTEWYGKSDGSNQNFDFTAPGYGAGTYTLTFTVNTSSKTVEMTAEKQVDYTVVGCFNNNNNDDTASFFGTVWDVANNDNNLVSNGDGTYSKTFYNVALEAGTIKYKVVEGHSWDVNWGFSDKEGGNADYGVNAAGTYDITFMFDPVNKLNNGYNLTCEVTATPATVAKTVSAAGYATYCSPYALDFTATEGLTAYTAKMDGSKVTFSEVTKVPANTGLLLKGEAGNYTINTTTETIAEISDNKLVGVTKAEEKEAGIFVLLDGTKGVGFYKTTNAFTVGANTAYIKALPNDARFIGFNLDEATGIEGVAAEKADNCEIYNLQGQRVMKAQKGLYIINGKKVLVK